MKSFERFSGTACASTPCVRLPVAIGALFALALPFAAGCGAGQDSAADSEAAELALDTNRLTISPGVERMRQHKGDTETVATQTRGLDMKNAYWLGRLAQIAEKPADEARADLERLGLKADADHFRFFDNTCSDAQAFYISTASLSAPLVENATPYNKATEDFAVLVFRGTEKGNWDDIGTDLELWNRPGVSPLGNAHSGFNRALKSLWEKPAANCGSFEALGPFLRAHHQFNGRGTRPLRRGAELYLAGHSLGGAMATLALAKTATEQCEKEGLWQEDKCFLEYTPVSALVTFGTPRVGDRSLGSTLATWMTDRTPIYRFVHGQDMVSTLPKVFGWYHPGYDGKEDTFKVVIGDSPLRMFVSQEGDRGNGSKIEDHRIKNYIPVLAKLAAR